MKRRLAIFIAVLVCLSASARAEEPQEGQSNKERDFLKELTYRQREYQSQQGYLADKEARIAEELNSDISLQNAEPSAATLQRIDNLKARILEYLQDQIKNNHDYISYLEIRISELLDYKFPTLKAIRKLDESGALTQPAAPASAEDMTPPAPEEPRGSAEDRPQTVNKEESAPEPPRDTPDPDEGAIQQYRHNRVPISTSE